MHSSALDGANYSMISTRDKILYVLTGPTAVGKTEIALAWSERNDAEIVSCDSLLFYRGMDIGTAKPGPLERARVPHHLIDICGVAEGIDITTYVALAKVAVNDIHRRGKCCLIAGGSGFYLRSYFAAVADDVTVEPELRAEIGRQLLNDGLPGLVAELRSLNPDGLGNLDTANPRRVTRALERCRASGKTLAELADDFSRKPAPFPEWTMKLTRLERESTELEVRIRARVEAMLRAGLVSEVKGLLASGLKTNPSAAKAIGYRETIDYLEGRLDESALAGLIVQNTKALVKKQRTWFRTQLPVHREVKANEAQVETLFS
jgi:tRNA dimethylallyltransferase